MSLIAMEALTALELIKYIQLHTADDSPELSITVLPGRLGENSLYGVLAIDYEQTPSALIRLDEVDGSSIVAEHASPVIAILQAVQRLKIQFEPVEETTIS